MLAEIWRVVSIVVEDDVRLGARVTADVAPIRLSEASLHVLSGL